MTNRDLLGCICLDSDSYECTRNCHQEGQPFVRPEWDDVVRIPMRLPLPNHPADCAFKCILDEEDERPHQEVVGAEAWSDGSLTIWFRDI